MSTSWNLVSAGPSRIHLRRSHLIPDAPVVTVNRALDVVNQGIPVDFAAFADGPGGCWELCKLEELWNPSIQLWVSLRPLAMTAKVPGMDTNVEYMGPPVMKLWDEKLPASVGLRPLPWGQIEDVDKPGCMRHAFTAYCAMKRILMFSPKRIRILCMDMEGSWIAGKTAEECHEIDIKREQLDRWKHERHAMTKLANETRAKGIAVEFVTPTPTDQQQPSPLWVERRKALKAYEEWLWSRPDGESKEERAAAFRDHLRLHPT